MIADKMNNLVKKNTNMLPTLMKEVENKIAVIRNQEVIADADVAELYGVETKRVNEAVRNNPDKFPPRYMFELTTNELRDLRRKFRPQMCQRRTAKPPKYSQNMASICLLQY